MQTRDSGVSNSNADLPSTYRAGGPATRDPRPHPITAEPSTAALALAVRRKVAYLLCKTSRHRFLGRIFLLYFLTYNTPQNETHTLF